MSNTINWKGMTDAEKNACFAERVAEFEWWDFDTGFSMLLPAGSTWPPIQNNARRGHSHKTEDTGSVPDYLHSADADAVLPWLQKQKDAWLIGCLVGPGAIVSIGDDGEIAYAEADSIPEAAMIALLRAKGIEVIT